MICKKNGNIAPPADFFSALKILRPYKWVNPPTAQRRHTLQSGKLEAQFFFGEADFFSAKRLFFRAARDVSGVRSNPPWARVEIKLKMRFQTLSHSPSHDRALALTSPPPDFLFSSIHPKPTIPQSPPNPRIQNSHRRGHLWHETNKKSRYGGDVRAGALSWA